ncbi:hypothetical protein GCM10023170_082630 [Phytohabitans houttuyneae]|uniref:SH3b domain-containing protein n=1 Tax=Phytohabitans houttuyneae TaxID=1076126 RepID=A0A6V8KMT7_9ACTN|nr:hypothetical protein Phou_061350 [Phytohabitans houttuyneae]
MLGGVLIWSSVDRSGTGTVDGTVRPGTTWNLRARPTTESRKIDIIIGPGTPVTVHCVEGRWARLDKPRADVYIYLDALALNESPKRCTTNSLRRG